MTITSNLKVHHIFCDFSYTQATLAADNMPAATANIAGFVKSKVKANYDFSIYKYPEDFIEDFLKNDIYEDNVYLVFSFSNYIWNSTLALKISRLVKKKYECVIIMGGPNFGHNIVEQKDFLFKNNHISYYIPNEGEQTTLNIIKYLVDVKFQPEKSHPIQGCCSLSKEYELVQNIVTPKIKDLSEIPSPYTSGYLDKFFDGKLAPILQTNRGCPFTCTFCVEGTDFYSRVSFFPIERVKEEIEYIAKKVHELKKEGKNVRSDLYIADSNFGMYPRDIQICQYLSQTREKYQWPTYINVATGKNSKKRVLEAAAVLEGALRLSGSVQSVDPIVLEKIKRKNIDIEALFELGLSGSKINANTYSEVILALPGETYASHITTLRTILDAGFKYIVPYTLMLLSGTPMATIESREDNKFICKYRVLPRAFGSYEISAGKLLSCGEVEEVVVGTKDISFEEYLQCREIHLLIFVFYNNEIFEGIIRTLRLLKIPILDWILRIKKDLINHTVINKIIQEFINETKNELFDSKEELQDFLSNVEGINEYLDGVRGRNLLFTYRTTFHRNHMLILSNLATKIACEMALEIKADSDIIPFLKNLSAYHVSSASDLLNPEALVNTGYLSYNVIEYIREDFEDLAGKQIEEVLTKYKLSRKTDFVLEASSSSKSELKEYLEVFGSNVAAASRIFSKIPLQKLFKTVKKKEIVEK
tara:strand:- start:2492 stop:4603 length:2112 start_codon:yes stop_codon:yes gene_type:complete